MMIQDAPPSIVSPPAPQERVPVTRRPRSCDSEPGEIVVCAVDPEPFRLRRIERPEGIRDGNPASFRIGAVEGRVEAEQHGPPSASAPAAMIRFKIKF